MTRRWDAVLLRALVAGGGDSGRHHVSAWPAQPTRIVLALGPGSLSSPPEPRWVGREAALDHGLATQIDIAILGTVEPKWARKQRDKAARLAEALFGERAVTERLCRVRFVFHEPPSEGVIGVANAVAAAASARGIEVSSSWLWGTRAPAPLGFVGHRDLARVGGADGLPAVLDKLFARIVGEGRASGLITGFAPGADRLAVERWKSLGLPAPTLVFPFRDGAGGDWLTDGPSAAGSDERITVEAARAAGAARLAAPRGKADAHTAQALDVVQNCGVLVALHDDRGASGKGSVGDTIAVARKAGRQVMIITRAGDGAWRVA